MKEKETIIVELPKPYAKLDPSFVVSGWVSKSWLNPKTDRRIFIEFIDIEGKTFMGDTIYIGNDKEPDSDKRLWFSKSIKLTHFNVPFIEKSKGRIVIQLSNKDEEKILYIPVVIKGFQHNNDTKIIEKHGKIGDKIVQYKIDLIKYNEKLQKIRKENIHRFNSIDEEGLGIEINVTDEKLAKSVLNKIKSSTDLKTVLYDKAKQTRIVSILNDEYKEALQWRGNLYKGGYEFFRISNYAVAFIFGWVLEHIIKDVDDILWDKVKAFAKKIFLTVKNTKKLDEKIPYIINSNKGKKIVFLFDTSMNLKEFEKAFILIADSLKQLKESDINNEMYRPLIFKFNKSKKKWEKENKT